ncbi:MAG: hypothetical protein AAGF35_12320 [Pseudomonadota bacterium]
MLTATEFYPLTTSLTVVLWIELIIYLGTGLYEVFDDFYRKHPHWIFVNGRLNTYNYFIEKRGHKMHAAFAMILGLIALHALLEGQVSRFEIELIFLSLALICCGVFCMAPPCLPLLLRMLPLTPEVLLQITMFALFADLIRPEVIGLCLLFNAWGLFVFFRKNMKLEGAPQTYEQLREQLLEAGAELSIKGYDRVMGYKPSSTSNERVPNRSQS